MLQNRANKGNAVVSWTDGKDGCLSCYKAMNDGYRITHLLLLYESEKDRLS